MSFENLNEQFYIPCRLPVLLKNCNSRLFDRDNDDYAMINDARTSPHKDIIYTICLRYYAEED